MGKKKKGEAQTDAPIEETIEEQLDELTEDKCADSAADSVDAPVEEAAPVEESDPSEKEIARLNDELAAQKESYLRLMAEYDNFRKRTQREKTALSSDIKSDVIAALLPVIDNLERALSADNVDGESMRKGVEMVLSQTNAIFGKYGVTSFGEVGDRFDPQLHHCVSTSEPTEQLDVDQISLVMQKGYLLGEKVIRPAMVQVVN